MQIFEKRQKDMYKNQFAGSRDFPEIKKQDKEKGK